MEEKISRIFLPTILLVASSSLLLFLIARMAFVGLTDEILVNFLAIFMLFAIGASISLYTLIQNIVLAITERHCTHQAHNLEMDTQKEER
ncbi:MAG: hypothetical protein WDZ40_03700 [Candidatus Spechtbacterales bacterium]